MSERRERRVSPKVFNMLFEIPCAIIVAQLLNRVCVKVHQPRLIGEIAAGILLGPCCLGALSYVVSDFSTSSFNSLSLDMNDPSFKNISFLGAIFLMFIVGLETDVRQIHATKKSGFLAGLFAVIMPFCIGYAIGVLFSMTSMQSIILGAILLSTSAVIALRIFTDLDILPTQLGSTMQTAVIVNEILAMGVFFIIFGNGDTPSSLIQIIVLFMIAFGGGMLLFSVLSRTASFTHKVCDHIVFSALVSCFIVASTTNNISIASIIGAFVIGLLLRKLLPIDILLRYTKQVGYAFFIPLFFVSIGVSFDFSFLLHTNNIAPLILFIGFFLLAGLSGNFIGGYIGSRLSGLNSAESRCVGLGMMPICGTALVLLTVTIDKGYFGSQDSVLVSQLKIATILLIIVSSLLTPLLLKRSLRATSLGSKQHVDRWSVFKNIIRMTRNRNVLSLFHH